MITLIHPSRGRPVQAYRTAVKWIQQAGVPVEHILSADSDDLLSAYMKMFPLGNKGQIIVNPNSCVVEAANKAAAVANGDLIIYLSDDFDCFENWGIKLNEIALRYQGEYLIKVHDGLQVFENAVLTIPIMSRELYQRLGYFFHPKYKSMWVDVDLYETCRRRNVIKYHPEILFQHNHYSNSNGKVKKDETYQRSDANWNQGKEILRMRRRENFR